MTTKIKTIESMNKMNTFELINGYILLGTVGRKNQFGEQTFLMIKAEKELLRAAKWLSLYRRIEKAVQPYDGCDEKTYQAFDLSTEVSSRLEAAYKRVEKLIPPKKEVQKAYKEYLKELDKKAEESEKKETKKATHNFSELFEDAFKFFNGFEEMHLQIIQSVRMKTKLNKEEVEKEMIRLYPNTKKEIEKEKMEREDKIRKTLEEAEERESEKAKQKAAKESAKKEAEKYTIKSFKGSVRILCKNAIPKTGEVVEGYKISGLGKQWHKGNDKYCYAYVN